jgi:hypothetical protein
VKICASGKNGSLLGKNRSFICKLRSQLIHKIDPRSLLALACSVILPVDKMVRKYLLAHLKKCSADFVTEEGKYARFAEKVKRSINPVLLFQKQEQRPILYFAPWCKL